MNNPYEFIDHSVIRTTGLNVVTVDAAVHAVNLALAAEPITVGFYVNDLGTKLEVLEPASDRLGIWAVKGSIWICSQTTERGTVAVLATSEHIRANFKRVKDV